MTAKRYRSTPNRPSLQLALMTILTGATAFAILGCQDPATGIFHHLAHQEPTVDRNLANDLTSGGVVRWYDVAKDTSQYIATAGNLWSRPIVTTTERSEWTQLANTYDGSENTAILLPLVRWRPASPDEPSLIAGALLVESERFLLLEATGSSIESDSISWTSVNGYEDHEVIALFTPDTDESVLFVVLADTRGSERTYTLLSASARYEGFPNFNYELQHLTYPIEAVTTDGTNYWAVSGNELYRGQLGSIEEWSASPPLSESEKFRGMAYGDLGSNNIVVSGNQGTLWRSQDGGITWADSEEVETHDSQNVPLTSVTTVGDTVLIATDGFGYYTANLENEEPAERLTLTTEAIYQASIRSFWVDPVASGSAQTVFALTVGEGLWSTTMAPGSLPENWQLE